MLDELAPRPAEDVLSRTVRITLGDATYALRVLTIAGNERWRMELDASTALIVDTLVAQGDDAEAILRTLSTDADRLIELLVAFDTDCGRQEGRLPAPAVLKEMAYEDQLIQAVREVWQAANPLAELGIRNIARAISLPPSSSSPPPTAGWRRLFGRR